MANKKDKRSDLAVWTECDQKLPFQRYYLLIIGAPRSGTTLLASMIACHTDIGILNEDVTGKWGRKILGKRIVGNKLCVPNQIQLKKKHPLAFRFFKKVGFIAESPRSRFSIEEYLEVSNLKIIGLIRNGNDVVSSMMRRGHYNFKVALRRWGEAIDTIHEVKRRYGDRVLVLAFEDLILNPEVNMLRVCEFLGVSFQKEMLAGYQYNLKYPESKLDEEKVHRHKKESIDFQLEAKLPSAYRQYQALAQNIHRPT